MTNFKIIEILGREPNHLELAMLGHVGNIVHTNHHAYI